MLLVYGVFRLTFDIVVIFPDVNGSLPIFAKESGRLFVQASKVRIQIISRYQLMNEIAREYGRLIA
jgi:hypothetical protein